MTWVPRPVALVLALVACGVAACASKPPPPPPPPKPTIVRATIDARPNVNPDARGRPSPVVVRLYELKSIAVFDSADFFSLYERDKDALGAELVARDEFALSPGEHRVIERQAHADSRHVAVLAAFRDLERSKWRATAPVVPNETTSLVIELDGNDLRIRAP